MSGRVFELGAERRDEAIELWQEARLTRAWDPPLEDFDRALEQPDAAVLGIDDDGALVGTVMVGVDGHRGWMYYLAVRTTHRGRGLGRVLVAAAEAWLADHGAPKAQLMVRGTNARALAFYERIGYEQQDVVVLGRRLD